MDFSTGQFLLNTVTSTQFGSHKVLKLGDLQPKEFKSMPTHYVRARIRLFLTSGLLRLGGINREDTIQEIPPT